MLLIVINVAVFAWQFSTPADEFSSPELRELGVPESDQQVIEYGAIPYRVTHPGRDCAAGVLAERGQRPAAGIVCEGTADYRRAEEFERSGEGPLVPLDGAAWWFTLLSSMFMHGGFLHIAGNMLFLWVFGNNIEDSMGRIRFLIFYLLAGLAAVYAQSLIDPDSTVPTIGASGAVAGVLGAYVLLHPRARVLTLIFIIFFVTVIEIPAMILLSVWFLLQFLPALGQLGSVEVAGGGVAYLAHVGGFVFGLIAVHAFTRIGRRDDRPPPAVAA